MSRPYVLVIGGVDPTGGAGLAADVRAVSYSGGYATSVATAIAVQTSQTLLNMQPLPLDLVLQQTQAVLEELRPDAVKIGLVSSTTMLSALLDQVAHVAVRVVDPVLSTGTGTAFHTGNDPSEWLNALGKATLVTPNLPEGRALLGSSAEGLTQRELAAELAAALDTSVLLKGGHSELFTGDVLARTNGSVQAFPHTPIPNLDVRGTGCALASHLAVRLAAYGVDVGVPKAMQDLQTRFGLRLPYGKLRTVLP